MREIKFRAWDKNNNKWLEPCFINVRGDGIIEVFDDEREETIWLKSDEIELIQFTGLKDKNGKEIYEGDIVEFPPFNKDWCEGDYLPRQRFTVDLSQLRLWLKEEMFGYEGELLLDSDKCEVIGNIYENPELSKV